MFAWGWVVATLLSAFGEPDLMRGEQDVCTYVRPYIPAHYHLGACVHLVVVISNCHRPMDGGRLGRCVVADGGNFTGHADPLSTAC